VRGSAKGAALVALLAFGFATAAPSWAGGGLTWLGSIVSSPGKNTAPRVVSFASDTGGVTIRFSERVHASSGSFELDCPTGHPHRFSLGLSTGSLLTLATRAQPLKVGTSCKLIVHAARIHDLAKPRLPMARTFTATFKVHAPLTPPQTPTRPVAPAPAPLPGAPPPATTATVTTTGSVGGGGGGGGGGGAAHVPADITLSSTAVHEHEPPGCPVGTFSATGANTGQALTFALVSTATCPGADDAAFTVRGAMLETAASFDFETRSSYSICVRVTDSGGVIFDKQFTVQVTDVNEPPTDLQLSNASVAENRPAGTVFGTLSSTDQDVPAQTFTYALVSGTGSADNASFTITGNQLNTAAGFDFETKSSYSIRIRTTDSGTPQLSFEKTFTISVTNVNEAPTDISLTPATVAEQRPVGTAVGTLTATDPDAGDTATFSLVSTVACPGADNGSFTISGSTLKTNATFDLATKGSYTICVRATDRSSLTFNEPFTVAVTKHNVPPTDIALSGSSFPENQPAGTMVGTLSDTDPNSGDTATFTLGCAGADNASFAIGGTALETAASFDFETKSSYAICVRATDNGGLIFDEPFTISVTDVNEPPVAGDDALSPIAEDSGPDTIPAASLLANDAAPAAESSQTLTITSVGNASGGTVQLSGANVVFTPAANYNGPASFDYTVTDNGTTNGAPDPKSATGHVSFTINAVTNQPPTANPQTVTTNEDAPTTITLTGSDPESDPLMFIVTTLPAAGGQLHDGASAAGAPIMCVPYTLSGTQVTYVPAANTNGTPLESFSFKANDGLSDSAAATVTINVTPVDDAPVAENDSVTVVQDSSTNTLDVLANDTDIDPGPMVIQSKTDGAHGTVAITNAGAKLTYTPAAGYCGSDSFTYTLNGGSNATVNVTVTCTNHAPVGNPDSFSTDEDTTITTGNVLANDTDAHGDTLAVASLDTSGTHGTVTNNHDGTFTYTPGPFYQSLAAGQSAYDVLSYTASDGKGGGVSAPTPVTINITGVDDPPTAVPDHVTTDEHTTLAFDAVANDIDPDVGDSLSIVWVGTPDAGGTVSYDGGVITFHPGTTFESLGAGQSRDIHFAYTVADCSGATSTAGDTVTVTGVDGLPGPKVAIVAPVDDASLAGHQQLVVTADGGGTRLVRIAFLVDGIEVGTAPLAPPYVSSWDTTGVSDGVHVLTAVATNAEGASESSVPVSVRVRNACTIFDTDGCEQTGGTFITFDNVVTPDRQTGFVFRCTGSLVEYRDSRAVITGSGWPVHLNIDYRPGAYDYANGVPLEEGVVAQLSGVSLSDGCTGDADPTTIDLVVHIAGDGRTYGLQADALKLTGSVGPSNIQITTGGGAINCGPREGSDGTIVVHEDAIQVQSGRDIGFYGVTIGDWSGRRATCWGAGGAFFLSSANGHSGQGITVDGMRAIACNHGLNGDASGAPTSGIVSRSVFRTGRPSDRSDVLATIDPSTGGRTVGLCTFSSNPVSAYISDLPTWSLDHVVADGWSILGDPWSPGFDPTYDNGAPAR
jgi:VCBS repeat-containing protein